MLPPTPLSNFVLSVDEIVRLTGHKRSAQQVGWLREHGWVFEQNAANEPVVGRYYATMRLCGVERFDVDSGPSARINFGALTAIQGKKNGSKTTHEK